MQSPPCTVSGTVSEQYRTSHRADHEKRLLLKQIAVRDACSVGGSVQGRLLKSRAEREGRGRGLGRINWLWDHHRGLCPFRSPHGPEMCRPGGGNATMDNLRHQTPALITAVAMALMRLCFVWHAVPTAQQLRMLCRLSCSMQPERASTAVLCYTCGAARASSWPCRGAAPRCGLIAKRSLRVAQHCASQHVCCLNVIPRPQRASARNSGAR